MAKSFLSLRRRYDLGRPDCGAAEVSNAPAADDADAIDALIRKMLHDGADSITLQYDRTLTNEEVAKLTRAFTVGVKRHCEQMYNSTSCRSYSSGKVLLTFSSTACDSAQLKKYREETLARAILVHDALWESGYLTGDMTQYELARSLRLAVQQLCLRRGDRLQQFSEPSGL